MASASTGQQSHTAAEQYEYDYDYIPPLALIKSVPGLGFSLEWAVLVFAVGLRVLVNLIALKIDKDLTDIDRELADIIKGIENRDLKATLLALLAVVVEIAAAYADFRVLEQQVKAIAADIGSGNYDKAKQDFAALLTTLARLISAGLPSGRPRASTITRTSSRPCRCRRLQTRSKTTPCLPICASPGPIRW